MNRSGFDYQVSNSIRTSQNYICYFLYIITIQHAQRVFIYFWTFYADILLILLADFDFFEACLFGKGVSKLIVLFP